jgi:catechol 2,3-dioxygenase-like lactoylglutathione lyase family enzyme
MAWALVAVVVLPGTGHATEPAYHDPGLNTVAQVAIVCRDIETSAKRWAAFLDVPVPKITLTKPGSQTKMLYKGQPSNAQVKLAFFKSGQVQIELLEPVGGPSAWKDGLDANGESIHHLGFVVNDLDRSIKALAAMGYAPIHSGRYDGDDGSYVYMDSRKGLGVIVEVLHSDPPKK